MNLYVWLNIFRGIVYLWIALTAYSISQLYTDGYNIANKISNLIKSLIRILFWISIIFGYFSISSFAQAFDIYFHDVFVIFAPIIVIPLGFLLTSFRKESIKQQK